MTLFHFFMLWGLMTAAILLWLDTKGWHDDE